MAVTDTIHKWGQDIERLVFWEEKPEISYRNRIIYKASELNTGKSVVYVKRNDSNLVAIVDSIGPDENTEPSKEDEVWKVELKIPETPKTRYENIKCHVEQIPYGLDKPARYELVIDDENKISVFKMLDDFDELAQKARENAALARFIDNCVATGLIVL